MLRLITVLALARISVAATTAPGTGYSDADSCPPPEKAPFGRRHRDDRVKKCHDDAA